MWTGEGREGGKHVVGKASCQGKHVGRGVVRREREEAFYAPSSARAALAPHRFARAALTPPAFRSLLFYHSKVAAF